MKYRIQVFVSFACLSVFIFLIQACEDPTRVVGVKTISVTDINYNSSTAHGSIFDIGEGVIKQHGFCYSESENPTIENLSLELGAISIAKSFSNTLVELSANTTYFIRAFALNSTGIYYGEQLSFTTLAFEVPSVTTSHITDVTYVSVTVGGTVNSEGGLEVVDRGIWYGLSSDPEITGTKVSLGNGPGAFTTTLTNLEPGTLYFFKAYASNSVGTVYGNELSASTIESVPPTVVTIPVRSVTDKSAQVGGNISSNGGSNISERGIWFGPSTSPETSGTKVQTSEGTGEFLIDLSGLSSETKYYFKAFATNNQGTSYGDELNFETDFNGMPISDFDGNNYNTVKIGEQWWTSENIYTTHYLNGDIIPDGTGVGDLTGISDAEYWFAFNDDTLNIPIFGRLYTWNVAVDSRNICPSGWHLPSFSEWQILIDFLGGRTNAVNKLKAKGITYWESPNSGTDESGFTALPGIFRRPDGPLFVGGWTAIWWTSTEISSTKARSESIWSDETEIIVYDDPKEYGFSVRCLRD